MKIGIGLPTGMEGLINPVNFFRPDDFVLAGQIAERLGYDSVWGNDHYAPANYVKENFTDPPNFYEVITMLTAVAANTTRVEVGTAVLVLPMRDPVLLARQAATLDQVSRGRLLLGLGIGAYREEYAAAFPERFGKNRGEILEEGLEVLTRLSTDDSVTFDGKYTQVDDLRMFPKPYNGSLRVFVGGHSQKAIERAVRWGDGWIPGWRPFDELSEWIATLRSSAERAGRDPASIVAAPQLSCLVGSTQEEAKRKYLASGMVQHRESLASTGRDPALAMDNNLIGSPDAILEKMAFLHEAGVDHLPCLTFCVNSVGEYFEQLHMFAEEVLRPFRREFSVNDRGVNV